MGCTRHRSATSVAKLWHAMQMLPPVAAISYKEVEAVAKGSRHGWVQSVQHQLEGESMGPEEPADGSQACGSEPQVPDNDPLHAKSAGLDSDSVEIPSGVDLSLAELLSLATPDYTTNSGEDSLLSPDRMGLPLNDLLCSVCRHVINRAVEAPCCHQLFCAACIFEWLSISAACPTCRQPLLVSGLVPVQPRVAGILSQVTVTCDYASTARLGCRSMTPLWQLRQHVSDQCLFLPGIAPHSPLRPVITPSAHVSDVLSSSPSKLRGDVS